MVGTRRGRAIHREQPSPASCYALAELSFLAARTAEMQSRERAQALYWDGLAHSYEYLFDPRYGARGPLTIRSFARRAICTTARSSSGCGWRKKADN